ncbi:hypothetical protein ACIPN8_07405 [Streptomyces sp. NPDC086082]|uniref:hypothetical protein n=1 Tax=Streptomyces sp. NPDC086082 TaxID=3365750 RepID=UPI0038260493
MTVDVAMASVVCAGTRWDAKAALRPRYTAADLRDAVMDSPLTITNKTAPFAIINGISAAPTAGRFFGTIHLDQLRLEGHCSRAPAGPRWTKRHTLAALAPVYRQLRESFEESKNEHDAADFHYGEMTMRRLDPTRPAVERALSGHHPDHRHTRTSQPHRPAHLPPHAQRSARSSCASRAHRHRWTARCRA